MPREQGPCAPPVRTRSSRVAAASNRASLRRRQAESSEAEHRARELMVLMEAELEKARGRGHAAAPRRAWSSRTSGSTAGSRGPGMSTSVVVMTARTRSRLTTTSATRRRRCVRRWRSWRRSAGRRLPATTSARHYRGLELARQLDSSPSLPTSSRPLAVSAPLVLRRGGRPRRVRAPPAAGPAAHELRQPRAPRAPPARSAGRGRRVRAPPPSSASQPPRSGRARAPCLLPAIAREMGRGERTTHLCVSLELRPKMGRKFGSPVGDRFGDPKTLLRSIFGFAYPCWRQSEKTDRPSPVGSFSPSPVARRPGFGDKQLRPEPAFQANGRCDCNSVVSYFVIASN